MKQLSELLKPWFSIDASKDRVIQGLALDSRLVQAGDLFFAYPGEKSDGRNFIQQAIQQGATAVLYESPLPLESLTAEAQKNNVLLLAAPRTLMPLSYFVGEIAARFYDYPSKKMTVVGVTGTNGKTSCTHFLAQFFTQQQNRCGVLGTVGNGIYPHLESASLTTADPITLQKKFSTFLEERARYVAMEVSSHSLIQRRVAGVQFTAAIFTNLTQDHLDYHKTMQAYAEAKSLLFSQPGLRYGIFNMDDPVGCVFAQQFKNVLSVFTYSLENKSAQIYCKAIQANSAGYEIQVVSPWGEGCLKTKLLGKFNVSNLLSVLATLGALQFSWENILEGLSQVEPPPGRMQRLGGGNQPLFVVDYAHTPDALEQVLKALREHCDGKLFCVFGCGGNRDRTKRALMGAIAERLADVVVITNDNPREENAEKIIQDILEGLTQPQNALMEADRFSAIKTAFSRTKVGDIILIAGKGHEDYQIIGTKKIHYSDAESVRKIFSEE